jgi:uncharacterized membrane protein
MTITRRMKEAFWVTITILSTLSSYISHPKPVYGPLIGAAIGCCSISIGIQQLYASSTQAPQGASRTVYLWSALTLILLGAGTVMECLPNMVQLHLSLGVQKIIFALSIGCFVIGFASLFRFAAAYLYRQADNALSKTHGFRIIRRNYSLGSAYMIEGGYLVVFIFCAFAAIAAYFWDDGLMLPEQISADDPIYFPLAESLKIFLFVGLFITAVCVLWFFLAKFRRIRRSNEPLDGIEFTLVMGVLFLAPILIQGTAAYPLAIGYESVAKVVICLWALLFAVVTGFIAYSYFEDDPQMTTDDASKVRRVKFAIIVSLVLCLGLCGLLLADLAFIKVIPFMFITLGFLTLACAHLPIHDLEQLSNRPLESATRGN